MIRSISEVDAGELVRVEGKKTKKKVNLLPVTDMRRGSTLPGHYAHKTREGMESVGMPSDLRHHGGDLRDRPLFDPWPTAQQKRRRVWGVWRTRSQVSL